MFEGRATLDEIRHRFDNDVERFSNLESGQTAAMDAPLALELISEAASAVRPAAKAILDLGCGAGNFSLRLVRACHTISHITLLDLSQPMLERASQRLQAERPMVIETVQCDLQSMVLPSKTFDVVLAGAVLHHLRTESEWIAAFQKVYSAIRPGGCFWIFDLVSFRNPAIQELMWNRYGQYLEGLGGPEHRKKVFEYSTYEDSPRSVVEQCLWLKTVGFSDVEILHANGCFSAFGGIKSMEKET